MSATTSTTPWPEEPAVPHPDQPRARDRSGALRAATGLTGLGLLAGLAVAISPRAPSALAFVLTGAGTLAAVALLAPVGLRALRRHRGAAVVLVLVVLWLGWWVINSTAGLGQRTLPYGVGRLYGFTSYIGDGANRLGLPWPLGSFGLLPLFILAAVVGGVVLLADAARAGFGVDREARGPWRLMTSPPTRRARVTGSAIGGVVLVAVAAMVSIGLLERLANGDVVLETLVLLIVVGGAVVVLGSPLLVGMLTRANRDQATGAREEERQRFAAHLHDSVLQTLALVQRQAHDPAAVARLARRQEHALRAWMAGESDLLSETLVAAIREVVAGVEDEHEVTIECTAIGDRPLEARGEAMAAAAREALRNAARHAPGAPIVVFAEITDERAEVFVRDQGPGFELDAVAAERRGIRDAILGRMASAGGHASIDSAPGEGTEVALTLNGDGAR
ncbi:MAG TPA: ATP-binding protein [Solirubrobacteraceae bacterium]|jgi:signal transduction histidine kinase